MMHTNAVTAFNPNSQYYDQIGLDKTSLKEAVRTSKDNRGRMTQDLRMTEVLNEGLTDTGLCSQSYDHIGLDDRSLKEDMRTSKDNSKRMTEVLN
jgi:hypothetical protein